MAFVLHASFIERSPQMRNLLSEEVIFIPEFIDPTLHLFSPLLGTNTEFLDDLDDSPETHNNDQRGNLLDDTVQDNVGDKTCDDDKRIKAVKPRFEITELISICCLSK